MTKFPLYYSFFLLLFFCSIQASAEPNIVMRGFGSASAQKLGTNLSIPDVGNTGSQIDLSGLSRFGVNLHADINDRFSVATQFLASGSGDVFNANLDWAFLSWKVAPTFSIRAGRLISPVWLYSQQIDVGYTYPWVQLPQEVYGLNPIKSINGASLLGELRAGPGVLQAEVLGGSSRSTFDQFTKGSEAQYDIRLSNYIGADLKFVIDELLTIRASYSQSNINAQVDSRLRLPAGSLPGINAATYLFVPTVLDANRARFLSLGVKSEFKDFFFAGEFARRWVTGTALTRASGIYASLGRHFGPLSAYGIYSWRGKMQGSLRFHPLYPTVTSLLDKMASAGGGINYQVHENIVLKGEYLRTKYGYQDSTRNFSFNHFLVSADFIF